MVAWGLVGVAVGLTAVNCGFLDLTGDTEAPVGLGSRAAEAMAAAAYLATTAVGALIATRRPGNRVGWSLCLGGFTMGLAGAASEYGAYGVLTDPGSLPGGVLGGRLVAWLGAWSWWAGAGSIVTFALLRFPDGHLPSRRWRPLAWPVAANFMVVVVAHAFTPGHLDGEFAFAVNPFGFDAAGALLRPLRAAAWGLVTVSTVLAMAGLFLRLRASTGEQHQQLKWVAYASGVAVVTLPLWSLTHTGTSEPPLVVQALVVVTLVGIPVAAGVAVLKYRLYGIDVVINKTVVVGALAAFVTAVYSAIVVGVGALLGDIGDLNLPLSLTATAVVAVAFQPVRERVHRFANTLVYGEQLSPYEALTAFTHRMTGLLHLEEVLPSMAEAAARGVSGASSRVRLFLPGGARRDVTWPDGSDSDAGAYDWTVEVVHQGETVGDIAVRKAPGDPLTDDQRTLLADLAAQAGLVMHNLRLTRELQARLAELQASRQRIVAAQDDERRRMERDIHDGAQQQLVSMAVKLGLAKRALLDDPERAAALLDELRAETHEAVDTLRDLARGIFPPLLVEQGPVVALNTHIAKLGLHAEVDAGPLDQLRLAPEVEAAIYFVLREALQNASKHAPGAPLAVRMSADDGYLRFTLRDGGPGFDPGSVAMGSGLQNMADRLAALGGCFELRSAPGQGTSVTGWVPLRPRQAFPAAKRDVTSVGEGTPR